MVVDYSSLQKKDKDKRKENFAHGGPMACAVVEWECAFNVALYAH